MKLIASLVAMIAFSFSMQALADGHKGHDHAEKDKPAAEKMKDDKKVAENDEKKDGKKEEKKEMKK